MSNIVQYYPEMEKGCYGVLFQQILAFMSAKVSTIWDVLRSHCVISKQITMCDVFIHEANTSALVCVLGSISQVSANVSINKVVNCYGIKGVFNLVTP